MISTMPTLSKFSFGVGDRFAHQAKAQLAVFQRLQRAGVSVAPVWNKSNREHTFIGSHPDSVRAAAVAAVAALKYEGPWHTDADHIRLETVDRFIPSCDFFTIDVAESIGKSAPKEQVDAFIARHPELIGRQEIARLSKPLITARADVESAAAKYLLATAEAAAASSAALAADWLGFRGGVGAGEGADRLRAAGPRDWPVAAGAAALA